MALATQQLLRKKREGEKRDFRHIIFKTFTLIKDLNHFFKKIKVSSSARMHLLKFGSPACNRFCMAVLICVMNTDMPTW